eukprot:Rmarinus@m.21822
MGPISTSDNMAFEASLLEDDLCAKKIMTSFKMRRCPRGMKCKKLKQGINSCPFFHHAGDRRRPLDALYAGVQCPNHWREKAQPESCSFAHNPFEVSYHPLVYRTVMCRKLDDCVYANCGFAHSKEELRLHVRDQSFEQQHLSQSFNNFQEIDADSSAATSDSGDATTISLENSRICSPIPAALTPKKIYSEGFLRMPKFVEFGRRNPAPDIPKCVYVANAFDSISCVDKASGLTCHLQFDITCQKNRSCASS